MNAATNNTRAQAINDHKLSDSMIEALTVYTSDSSWLGRLEVEEKDECHAGCNMNTRKALVRRGLIDGDSYLTELGVAVRKALYSKPAPAQPASDEPAPAQPATRNTAEVEFYTQEASLAEFGMPGVCASVSLSSWNPTPSAMFPSGSPDPEAARIGRVQLVNAAQKWKAPVGWRFDADFFADDLLIELAPDERCPIVSEADEGDRMLARLRDKLRKALDVIGFALVSEVGLPKSPAARAYRAAEDRACDALRELPRLLGTLRDEAGASPDWSDVGTVNHAAEQLEALVAWLKNEDE